MKSPFEIVRRVPAFAGFLVKKPGLALRVLQHQARASLTGRAGIQALEYAVTYDCPAGCDKCSARRLRDTGRQRMGRRAVCELAEDCHRLGTYEVNFTGGEPLMEPDLEELVALFHPRSTFIGINTNGHLLDRRRIRSLRAAGVDLLKISLDSPVPDEHDASRHLPGLFAHILQVLRLVQGTPGLRAHLCVVTTREAITSGRVAEVAALARQHRATVGLVLPAAVGGWAGRHDVLLEPRHRRALDRLARDRAVFLQGNLGSRPFTCPCGTREIYVSCYGDVLPCPFIQISFGNVMQEPFETIYRRMATWKERAGPRHRCASAEDHGFVARYIDPLPACSSAPVRWTEHPAWTGPDPARPDRG